jgi:SPP1 family predicted phage head-tail adaptor
MKGLRPYGARGHVTAGKRPYRLTIRRASFTQDPGSGENVETWADLGTVFASKQDVSDGEKVAAAEVSATITTRFVIAWSATVQSVNPKDQVVCDGRTYDLWGVKELGFHEALELTAAARSD